MGGVGCRNITPSRCTSKGNHLSIVCFVDLVFKTLDQYPQTLYSCFSKLNFGLDSKDGELMYITHFSMPHINIGLGPFFFPNFFLKHWLQIWLCCWKKIPTSNLELSLSLSSAYKPFFPLLLRFFVCFDLHFSKWTLQFFSGYIYSSVVFRLQFHSVFLFSG